MTATPTPVKKTGPLLVVIRWFDSWAGMESAEQAASKAADPQRVDWMRHIAAQAAEEQRRQTEAKLEMRRRIDAARVKACRAASEAAAAVGILGTGATEGPRSEEAGRRRGRSRERSRSRVKLAGEETTGYYTFGVVPCSSNFYFFKK